MSTTENGTNNGVENTSDQMIKKLCRQLAYTRIICIITSILTMFLLLGGVYLSKQIWIIAEQVQPVIDQVAAVDIENANAALRQVKDSLEDIDLEQVMAALDQAVSTLEEVDIDALNHAIEGLDTRELSETLANINEAASSLRDTEALIKAVFGIK